jgi:peptidyl-prolyl cis-trans isomerase A (cyclophilin A)
MNRLLWCALFLMPLAGRAETVTVVLHTELGEIVLELFPQQAPKTVANFLHYVAASSYNGGLFHRAVKPENQPENTVKIEVIQAGVNPEKRDELAAPIALERTSVTGLRHRDGTVSMARTTPDSARTEFFICIGNQPELDFGGRRNPDGQGFAAFGKVTRGMDVVRKIQQAPAEAQRLTPPVRILKASRAP